MYRFGFVTAFVLLLFASCKQYTDYVKSDASYSYYVNEDRVQNYLGKSAEDVFKVQIPVKLIKRDNNAGPLGLQVNGFGAFDVYWDGIFVGSNGKMAKSGQPEVAGTEMTYYEIPERRGNIGMHMITIIGTQTQLREAKRGIDIRLESFLRLHRAPLIVTSFMNLMAGAFLIAAVYYFFMYINSTGKEATVLLFGIICLLFFCLLIISLKK